MFLRPQDELVDYDEEVGTEAPAAEEGKDTGKYVCLVLVAVICQGALLVWPRLLVDFSKWVRPVFSDMCCCAFAFPRGHYVGIHTSNFRDFLLKPELLRAVVDCGFENPSEGV